MGQQTYGQSRRISGQVIAATTSPVSFGVAGTVAQVNVMQGVRIRDGQVLAILDKEPFRLATQTARAELNVARVQFMDTQRVYDQVAELLKKNAATQREFEAAATDHASAHEQLQAAQFNLHQKTIDLQRTELSAPFSGTIAERSIEPFQEVTANYQAFVLQTDGTMKVKVRVPETLIREVDYGQAVKVKFPTLQNLTVNGTVSSIGSRAESGNAFPVEVQLLKPNTDLLPGMTASVTFNFNKYLDNRIVYLIPISALAIEAGLLASTEPNQQTKPSDSVPVFVYDESTSQLRTRQIVVGDLRGNLLEVFDGLKAGDKVVSAGVTFLRDGMQVSVWQPEQGLSDG